MARALVEILGDSTSLKAALGSATAAADKFAADYTTAFDGMSTSTLRLAAAQDKLAISTARYGAGTTGAADATLRYRRELDAVAASQDRAAARQLAAAASIGKSLTTYITVPLAIAGYEAVKMGVDFQQQMLLIQTQAGASAQEVQKLSGAVLKLAPAVGIGPSELAKGLYHLESLGLRGVKAMDTLRIASIAAGMGVADLETTASALGAVVVTGIQGAQDYQQAMATLTATIGAGNMRMEDLAGSIGNVAPAAAAAGISLPELGAAMATLTDRGFSAEEAATRLRMSLALIQNPTPKAVKALADMGVNAKSLAGILRGPNGLLTVLQLLSGGLHRVGQTRGNRDLLAGFGGGRSGLGIQTLVQSLDQPVSSYAQKLDDVSSGTQKTLTNTTAYMHSAAFKLHQDLAEIQTDFTKAGKALIPIALDIGKAADAITKGFDAMPGPVKQDIAIIAGLLAVGGPLMLAGTGVVKMIKKIQTTFGLLPMAARSAAATTTTELAGVEASAAAATAEVSALRTALLGLGALGAITIGIDLVEHLIKDYRSTKDLGSSTGQGGMSGHVIQQNGHYYLVSPANAGRGGPGGMRPITKKEAQKLLGNQYGSDTYSPPVRGVDTPSRFPLKPAPGSVSTKPDAIQKFVVPYKLQVEAARAQLTKSQADDLQAARDTITYIDKLIKSGRLSKAAYLEAITEEGNAEQQLYSAQTSAAKNAAAAAKKRAKAAQNFTLPTSLQVLMARADALAALNPNLQGPTSLQLSLAKKAKADAMRAINSHTLTLKALIDAWNIVGQANQTLAQAAKGQGLIDTYHSVSTRVLTAGLNLTRDQRISLEQRLAQAAAHRGYTPATAAAQGYATDVTVYTHDTDHLIKKIDKRTRHKKQRNGGRR